MLMTFTQEEKQYGYSLHDSAGEDRAGQLYHYRLPIGWPVHWWSWLQAYEGKDMVAWWSTLPIFRRAVLNIAIATPFLWRNWDKVAILYPLYMLGFVPFGLTTASFWLSFSRSTERYAIYSCRFPTLLLLSPMTQLWPVEELVVVEREAISGNREKVSSPEWRMKCM